MATHHDIEPQNEHEAGSPPHNINVAYVALAAAVGTLLLVVIIVGTEAWHRASVIQFREQRLEASPSVMDPDLKKQVETQRANLTREGQWLDSERTRARIPIETAKDLIVHRYRAQTNEAVQPEADASAPPAAMQGSAAADDDAS